MRIPFDDHCGLMLEVESEAHKRGLTFREACREAFSLWMPIEDPEPGDKPRSKPNRRPRVGTRSKINDNQVGQIRSNFTGQPVGIYCQEWADAIGCTRGAVYHILVNRHRRDPAYHYHKHPERSTLPP